MAAFTTVQLVLRFFQALRSGYEIFIITFQQTHNLIKSPSNLAVTFNTIIQKAFNKEQQQNLSANGARAALLAQSQNRPLTEFYTYCKKPCHTKIKCQDKYPHLKKEFKENWKKRDRKRKNKSEFNSTGNSKELRTSNSNNSIISSSPVIKDGLEVSALMYNFNCLIINELTLFRIDTALLIAYTAL